jgi:replication factor A1
MMSIPLPQIKERIKQKTGMPEDEINQKIKAKLKQLPGLISEEGAAHIVANELGVKLFDIGEKLQIKNILSGMRNVDVIGKVVQKYELREYKTEKSSGKVANMLIGDETGVVRVVLWHKQTELFEQLKEGDIVKIRGAYVRDNNNRKELHLSEASKLIINPPGVEVSVKERAALGQGTRKNIADIKEDDASVEILATIVQVFDLNFFEVCPQCNKRARLREEEGFVCQTHGRITPDYNYVLNLYLDDGSDNMRAVFWRQQVEQLLGMDKPRILTFKEDPAKFEPIKTDLLGSIIKVSGRANKNQNFDRIELVASTVERNPDPDDEIKKLKEEAAKAVKETESEPGQGNVPRKDYPKPEPKKASSSDDDIENMDLDEELMDIG